MAEISPSDHAIFSVMSGMSLGFLFYHAYAVDRFACLKPSRREWFKNLLTYMLFLSNISILSWSLGWSVVKYDLGYVKLGPWDARPWPSALFPEKFQGFNLPLTVLLGASYSLSASLNAEEGLYWYHLMRAVRRPQAAVPFLKSTYFSAWVVISLLVGVIQLGVPWWGYHEELIKQLATELLVGGLLEFVVVCASTIVLFKFPAFLAEVKASGAGPDVRIRLHYYDKMNRIRTFLRFLFAIPLLILGADGVSESSIININPIASSMLATLAVGSLSLVTVVSIILYLPRTTPSSTRHTVMVGQQPPQRSIHANQLMSMLREGGQWEGLDDDLGPRSRSRQVDDAPFARAEERGDTWDIGGEEKWDSVHAQVPALLGTFVSPIAVSTEQQPSRPVAIHIQVETATKTD